MRILKLTKETQNNILENLLKRSPNSYGEFESRVNDIIQNVREKRDEAIFVPLYDNGKVIAFYAIPSAPFAY